MAIYHNGPKLCHPNNVNTLKFDEIVIKKIRSAELICYCCSHVSELNSTFMNK